MILNLELASLLSRSIPTSRFPTLARSTKLSEEVGEFAEATLVTLGYIDKNLKEPQVGELADVILCSLDTWLSSNPGMSLEEATSELNNWLYTKTLKWASKYPDITLE